MASGFCKHRSLFGASQQSTDHRQTRIVVLEEFLAPAELEWVHAYAWAREHHFVRSQVIGEDMQGLEKAQHRRSRVLYDVGGFYDLLGSRLMRMLPQVCHRLGVELFPVTALELQLTASNDGDFFRPHADSDSRIFSGRKITFVYFCHREPRAFTGGALRIFGRDPATGVDLTDISHAIEPIQNSVVFFLSDRLHEIAPIGCPSRTFVDSRMTLNGWLYR